MRYKVKPEHREFNYVLENHKAKMRDCISKINVLTEPQNEHLKLKSKKYDITVENYNNFFANGMLVHNSAWNEPIPKTKEDMRKLAKKGEKLLERYEKTKQNKKKKKKED
jgi:hypothetical protein